MQDLQATIQMVLDYIKGIWIKKRFIIMSSWLIVPLGLFLVAQMPDVYESKAKVFADTRSMLRPLLRGLAIQTDASTEIQLIAKTLLSRPNLEEIARNTDMDIKASSPQEFNEIVEKLREDINFNSGGRENIYTISYTGQDPQLAKRVVSATLDKFVESSLGQNRQDSDTASKFLDEQLEEYSQRLSAAEQRLATFKKQYGDMMAGSGSGYYQEVSNLKSRIEAIDLEISEKSTQLQSLKDKFSSSTNIDNKSEHSNIATQYDARIKQLQANLDDLQIRFTDKHPDVVQTREKLDHLVNLRKTEIEELMTSVADGQVASGTLSENAIVQDLSIAMNNLDSNIASLTVRRQSFKEKLDELDQKLDLIPDIEAKQSALNRDYGITKGKYEELLSRKESADLSRKADMSAEEVKFRIIEPPMVPLQPTGPKRLILYTVVTILGFVAGIAVAFLVSQLNPVVVSANALTELTNRPVFGMVTDIHLEDVKKRDKKRLYVFIASSVVVFGMYLLFMATEIVMETTPLKLLERFL
ncbi:chain-length determining protein [Psychrosphaera sp. B3R10]|uniref:XrtA system polysaccharide chain length determinant n=1 Tax=unclassified Psychrosphaera TaxID=2641570 RepID=UPI001C084D7E|nr:MULTISPECIES: XrtA system polysaccharide chain length determinant [unclassified Psychrosphaera]MBU2883709.1 chain-length determining protein [Psychrosphaera sp. I2R16]MBU2987989.1 chain-length determining protein [Psychrosphaera sp. B3R10]MDO6720361.1 chain-length determining protein [Psychrosphaera sp. 1_MG-2023]